MRVFYAEANFGEDEINAAIDVLRNNRLSLMAGDQCSALEKKVAHLFGKPFGLMTNSGSSANLLAIKSLDLPQRTLSTNSRQICDGLGACRVGEELEKKNEN